MIRMIFSIIAMLMILFQAVWIPKTFGESSAELLKKLSSTNALERRDAARKLGKVKDPASVGALIQALKDPEPMVRLDASGALIDIGPPVVDPLIQAMKGETHHAFLWNAIRILDTLKDPKALDLLEEIAKTSSDPNIQHVARSAAERLQKSPQSP